MRLIEKDPMPHINHHSVHPVVTASGAPDLPSREPYPEWAPSTAGTSPLPSPSASPPDAPLPENLAQTHLLLDLFTRLPRPIQVGVLLIVAAYCGVTFMGKPASGSEKPNTSPSCQIINSPNASCIGAPASQEPAAPEAASPPNRSLTLSIST